MSNIKPLTTRANRLLGANLVEKNLVTIDDLDEGNERLLELLSSSEEGHRVSLLSIMMNEKQSLYEGKLIEHQVDEFGLGIIDIRNIEFPEELAEITQLEECWATWTVPFDMVEDTYYLATAYYLSPVVREFWEEKLSGKVVWYVAPMESITDFLESREADKAKAALSAN